MDCWVFLIEYCLNLNVKKIISLDDLINKPINSISFNVKNVDEVLKVALIKPLKRVEWVEVDQISKKDKLKEELSTH